MDPLHITESIDDYPEFKCANCEMTFSTENTLSHHKCVPETDNVHLIKCEFCPRKFLHAKNLNLHLRKHSKSNKFKCTLCDKFFSTKKILRNHRRLHDSPTFPCDACEKTFHSRRNLKQHERNMHSGDSTLRCKICKVFFETAFEHSEHLEDHKRQNVCKICLKEFLYHESLLQHLDNHQNGKQYECDMCSVGFAYVASLKRHMRAVHEKRRYPCGVCLQDFSTSYSRKRHRSEVHNLE